MSKKSRGFSIIELMIAVAIIGTLVVVAYPAYDNYIKKSRRTEATTTLMEIAQKQEDFRSDTNSYYTGTGTDIEKNLHVPLGGKEYYEFSSTASKSKYTLTAIPKANSVQLKDETCAMFFLTQTGQKVAKRKGGNDGIDPITDLEKVTTNECW